MPNYSRGVIYKIVYNGKIVYIGSTTQGLAKRMNQHRNRSKSIARTEPFYVFVRTILPNGMKAKDGVFNIVEVCKYGCNSKSELEAKEYEELNKVLLAGEQCYNDKVNGFHSVEAREKMSSSLIGHSVSNEARANMSIAKIGENNNRFNSGCVRIAKKRKNLYWVFQYYQNGVAMASANHSIAKLGYLPAKQLAIADRLTIYPNYKPSFSEQLAHQRDVRKHQIQA